MESKLRKIGFLTKLLTLGMGSLFAFLLLILGFVFPPFWVGSFIVFGLCVGTSIGYRARGRCPICDEYIEVTKKRGGVRCRGCGEGLIVKNRRLIAR